MTQPQQDSGIKRAVDAAGGAKAFAAALGITKQAVYAWLDQGYVPIGRVVEIEAQFGVSRNDLVKPQINNIMSEG